MRYLLLLFLLTGCISERPMKQWPTSDEEADQLSERAIQLKRGEPIE